MCHCTTKIISDELEMAPPGRQILSLRFKGASHSSDLRFWKSFHLQLHKSSSVKHWIDYFSSS